MTPFEIEKAKWDKIIAQYQQKVEESRQNLRMVAAKFKEALDERDRVLSGLDLNYVKMNAKKRQALAALIDRMI